VRDSWFHGRRVGPNRRYHELLVIVVTGCGWLPPDSPPAKPVPPDPDAALFHDWKITEHVLGPRALISEYDAAAFHGRTVALSATGYSSPWSGSCDDAHREHHPRTLADVTTELGLARDRAARLGLADPIVEYQLTCGLANTGRTPPLTLYVGGAHALTCWSGVCYVLAPAQPGGGKRPNSSAG
jgi:hypothetical protein